MAAESVLTSNFDVIFLILSLLPTETLGRAKSVCRAWAQVISDPVFARAHCTSPAPIAALVVLNTRPRDNPIEAFRKLTKDVKMPSSDLSRILRDEFRPVSGSHGLLCFHRKRTFLIGNPATSRWVVVRDTNPPDSGYEFCGGALLYDPKTSLHFKLAVAMARLVETNRPKFYIRFHIYSSENSSWVMSSVGITWLRFRLFTVNDFRAKFQTICNAFNPSKIGGGSVCWLCDYGSLMVYEIATDTYWKTKPPNSDNIIGGTTLTGYNGTIFYLKNRDGVAKLARVWRLEEEKNNWIFDVECSYEMLTGCCPFAYDHVKGALLLRTYDDIIAGDLGTSVAVRCGAQFSKDMLLTPLLLHANSLAPFYDSTEDQGRSFMEIRKAKYLPKNSENNDQFRLVTYTNLGFVCIIYSVFLLVWRHYKKN